MNFKIFLPYLLVMAIVTYLIRVIPLVLVKHKIKNKFFNSFLYYIPYTVLAAMTIPAIFTATGNLISAIAGLAVAIVLAYQRKSLIVVAVGACAAVFMIEGMKCLSLGASHCLRQTRIYKKRLTYFLKA